MLRQSPLSFVRAPALGGLLAILASLAGCALEGPAGASAPLACERHADCPARHACEPEDEGLVCRSHGDDAGSGVACAADTDCPVGEECELEHGVASCRDHGGDDAPAGSTCASDADCPAGQECELEHGGSYCKPHGGDDDGV